jgi:nucleoside-diphosphate-sugar epimerase
VHIKRVVVLGSKGQIGGPLKSFLEIRGVEVIEFDYVIDNSQDLRLSESKILSQAVENSDFVFFLAFDVGGSSYLKHYERTYEFLLNNIKIMQNVFQELKKHNKPFIFASSQMSNMHFSPYGSLKNIGEFFTSTLKGISARFWNVYGPEHDPEKFHVVSDFIVKAKNFGEIRMNTDGRELRDFLFVDDCCEALYKIMINHEELLGKSSFDIASFQWNSIITIAKTVAKFIPARIIPSQNQDSVQRGVVNTPNPAILEFWQPKTNLEDGIRQVIHELYDQKS